jgi:hypothetical protein
MEQEKFEEKSLGKVWFITGAGSGVVEKVLPL